MTTDKFIEILNEEDNFSSTEGDDVVTGILIMIKYLPSNSNIIIQGAGHDDVWGPNIDELVDAGITEEDTHLLRKCGWRVEDHTYLAHFV